MIVYLILAIIIIIGLCQKNKELTEENNKLKSFFNKKGSFCPLCGSNLQQKNQPEQLEQSSQPQSQLINQEIIDTNLDKQEENLIYINSNIQTKESKYTEKEIKNSLILIVGSVLIILSALLFLTTTWNITHNIFKTLVIILMLFVFLIASYIAEKILNLKQTAKAFYYIALAYLPILFFSISLFSLFGKYFSIYGLGKYIYFTISSVIITIIYYEQSKKKDSYLIGIASVIFSFLSILFLGLSISNNYTFITLILCAYILILNILYQSNYYYLNKELHKKILLISIPTLIIIIFYNNIWNIILDKSKILDIITEVIMFYNIYLLEEKISDYSSINYIYPLYIVFVFFNISCFYKAFIIKQIFIIIGVLVIYIYDLLKKDNIQHTSYIETIACMFITYMCTMANSGNIIPSFCIMFIISMLSLIFYKNNNKEIDLPLAEIFCGTLMLSAIDFIIKNVISKICLGYISLIFISISLIIKEDKKLKQSFYWIGNIVFIFISILTTLLNYHYNIFLIILYILYCLVAFILTYTENNNICKIFGYIYTNFVLLSLKQTIDINNLAIILSITTIIFISAELLYKSLDEKNNNMYIIIQLIIASLLINTIDSSIINFLLLIIMNLSFICYIKYHKWNNNYMYIPAISIIPYIYFKEILIYNNINYMFIISIAFMILFNYLIYKKKDNIYIILFYTYAYLHIQSFNQSHYISLLIITTGTFISYLIKTEKTKDVFKAILYTCGLAFILFIIKDLNINNIISPAYVSYLIWIALITRNIVKKYNPGYKYLEYIGYILINLMAIQNYRSEADGILFVFALTAIVIISYLHKFGPIFLVSILSILVNVLLLTRTFWLSIPWWLYILIIGSILVGFAIYNEVNLKKEKNIVNDIKNKLDL